MFVADAPAPVLEEMTLLQQVITEVRALRKEIGVEERASVPIEVRADAGLRQLAEENRDWVICEYRERFRTSVIT